VWVSRLGNIVPHVGVESKLFHKHRHNTPCDRSSKLPRAHTLRCKKSHRADKSVVVGRTAALVRHSISEAAAHAGPCVFLRYLEKFWEQ
jgi:hypothetical protein